MLMSLMPRRSSGPIFCPSVGGWPVTPNIVGTLGPYMSASSRPTVRAEALQREREVRGDRALADAALAAHHEHDGFHSGNGVVGRRIAARQVEGHGPP